ncbi:MAG: HYR domain-containing protein [Lewinellaceae bacterium]|nr:HYR domain-containing protein [Lewinellaceae bacterium]
MTTETYTVADAAGLSASCSFTVTVTDAQNPTITCPADITRNNDAGQCSAVVSYNAPTGADNCPGATTAQTAGLGSGAAFPVGMTTETYTVADAAGLSASCSFTVTVTDAQNPTISCPADITRNNDAGQCSAVVSYNAPTGADNCPGATTAQTAGLGSGAAFPVGMTTETYTVADAAGSFRQLFLHRNGHRCAKPNHHLPGRHYQEQRCGPMQRSSVLQRSNRCGQLPGATTVRTTAFPGRNHSADSNGPALGCAAAQ